MRGWLIATVVMLFVLAAARFAFFAWNTLDLAPDEAYYWLWSQHPALSYHSKGPMVAWVIGATTAVLGHTPLGVRAGAATLTLITSLLAIATGARITGSLRAGLLAAVMFNIIPLSAVGAVISTPDTPLALMWLLALYAFYRWLGRERSWGWSAVWGAALGLALLSKHTAVLLGGSSILYLIVWHEHRARLKDPSLYIGILVAALVFLPDFLWNATSGWISYTFLIMRGGLAPSGRDASMVSNVLRSLCAQAGTVTPILFVLLVGEALAPLVEVFRKRLRGGREPGPEWWKILLASWSLPTLALFGITAFVQTVEADWPAPGYIGAFFLLGWRFDRILQSGSSAARRAWLALVGTGLVLAALVTLIAHSTSILRVVGVHLLPQNDPTTRLVGWREMADSVAVTRQEMPHPEKTFILTREYAVASELAFYLREPHNTFCAPVRRWSNQFDYFSLTLDERIGMDALYVEQGNGDPFPEIVGAFRRMEEAPSITIIRNGVPIRAFRQFKCFDFQGIPSE